MLFLGLLFLKDDESVISEKSHSNVIQNQSNMFQWNIIDGLLECKQNVRIINCLPVGTYPIQYSEPVLKSKKWLYGCQENLQIGSINIPVIKQITREIRLKRALRKNRDKNIIIYSAYLPFLRAVKNLDRRFHITLIVTDLPEYYDLGHSSLLRKALRRLNTWLVYRSMKRIDSFVLLTEQMKEPLHLNGRTNTVIEGICSGNACSTCRKESDGKKVVLYSGTLHYQFGIKTLLDAFSLIEDENYELWICGSGEAEREIEKRVKEDNRIRFFGFCSSESVAELRTQASVLVNPRTNDGEYTKYSFPSKTMEYLASGVPVVAYKLSGIPDEYDNYLNYVPDNSVEMLTRKIVEVCEDSQGTYEKKAQYGKSFVEQSKSPSAQAKKIVDMLDGIDAL